MAFIESRWRTIVKAITFRIIVVTADMFLVYFVTGSYEVVVWVIILTNVSATIVYIIHERIWNRIHWGKAKHHNGRKK